MSEYKGLAAIKAMQEEEKRKAAERERPKAEYFKFPKDGPTTAKIRFIQEMDATADNYSEDRDIGLIKVEHQAPGPDGFKRRANCTLEDEGQCYACERHAMKVEAEEGGWRQRKNLYINALVSFDGEEPKVMVLTRSGGATFTAQLVEEAIDENTITAKNYKVTKSGSGTTTQWLLKDAKDAEPFDDSNAVPFNLAETVLRAIPYEKQAEYYGAVYSGVPTQGNTETVSVGSDTSAEW